MSYCRQMLKNDKKAETTTVEERGLQETCRLSGLGTPRMLRVVAKVLSPEKQSTAQLKEAIDKGRQSNTFRFLGEESRISIYCV